MVFSEIRKSKRSTYQLLGEEAAEQRNPQNRDQVVNKEAEVVEEPLNLVDQIIGGAWRMRIRL